MKTLIARVARVCCLGLCLAVTLGILSSCSGTAAKKAPPPVWTHFQGSAFAMNYFSNWSIATKDLYLGTHYPPLEMLQGMLFTSGSASTTYLQVSYATSTSKTASAKDIMLKFLLTSSSASSLSTTTLDNETWYQGSLEKQVKQSDGSLLSIKETALGVNHKTSAHNTEIYLIFYQDAASTYTQNTRAFFERMVNSFHFMP